MLLPKTNQIEQIKLIKSKTKMRCCEVRRILRYHEPNKILYLEKYPHHFLLFFYPFLSECSTFNQNKRLEPGVQTVVNSNKIKFQPSVDLVDETYPLDNANMFENQACFVQIEIYETEEAVYCNDQDDENIR